MIHKRTVSYSGKTYEVRRLYSSGVGEQFSAHFRDGSGAEKTLHLTDASEKGSPLEAGLFEACRSAFANFNSLNKTLNHPGQDSG